MPWGSWNFSFSIISWYIKGNRSKVCYESCQYRSIEFWAEGILGQDKESDSSGHRPLLRSENNTKITPFGSSIHRSCGGLLYEVRPICICSIICVPIRSPTFVFAIRVAQFFVWFTSVRPEIVGVFLIVFAISLSVLLSLCHVMAPLSCYGSLWSFNSPR